MAKPTDDFSKESSADKVIMADIKSTDRWRNEQGQYHRIDGPAVECVDGYKAWYMNGQYHRADGPAIEGADGFDQGGGVVEVPGVCPPGRGHPDLPNVTRSPDQPEEALEIGCDQRLHPGDHLAASSPMTPPIRCGPGRHWTRLPAVRHRASISAWSTNRAMWLFPSPCPQGCAR